MDATSNKAVTSHEAADTTPPPLWELRATATKGLGLFAVRPIRAGTTIVRDRPMMRIPIPGHLYAASDLTRAFAALPSSEKSAVLGLSSSSRPASEEPLYRIFKANAFGDGRETWLLARVCRINHSCVPNSTTVSEPAAEEHEVSVVAERDIAAGEEITISYNNDMCEVATARERAVLFRNQYGFTCACEVCVGGAVGRASDARRRLIAEVGGKLHGLGMSAEALRVFADERVDPYSEEGAREVMRLPVEKLCLEQRAPKEMGARERMHCHLMLAQLRTVEGLEASTIAQNWWRAAEALLEQMMETENVVVLPWAQNVRTWMERALEIMNRVRSPYDHDPQTLRDAWGMMKARPCLKVALAFVSVCVRTVARKNYVNNADDIIVGREIEGCC
jgi:hypothetical protein